MSRFLDGPLCEEQWGSFVEAPSHPRLGLERWPVDFPYVDLKPGPFYKIARYRWTGYGWIHAG